MIFKFKSSYTWYQNLFMILLSIIGMCIIYILYGYVFKEAWNMSIVPLFNMNNMSLSQAVGIMLGVSILKNINFIRYDFDSTT